jgi:hypothetical protein
MQSREDGAKPGVAMVAYAEPMVRIRLPPGASLRTIGMQEHCRSARDRVAPAASMATTALAALAKAMVPLAFDLQPQCHGYAPVKRGVQ